MAIDDKTLSAYLDGELDGQEEATVQAALEQSPELRRRLERFRRADRLAQTHLTNIDKAPLPASVTYALQAEGNQNGKSRFAAQPIPIHRRLLRHGRPALVPLAASIALVFGFLAGLAFPGLDDNAPAVATLTAPSTGRIPSGHPVYAALESTPSGQVVTINGATEIRAEPVLTFRSQTGHYCRELLIADPESATRSIACRQAPGLWQIKVMAEVPVPMDGQYVPAGDMAEQVLDRTAQALMDGAPLGQAAEAELIGSGWPDAKTRR